MYIFIQKVGIIIKLTVIHITVGNMKPSQSSFDYNHRKSLMWEHGHLININEIKVALSSFLVIILILVHSHNII